MNPDTPFTTIGDEPVEARIVAWVLGEASAFEAAELERLCEEKPELMVFKRRMLALHGLLNEAENPQADDAWKLTPEKRKAVEFALWKKNVADIEDAREKRVKHGGRRALLAIAACFVILVIVAGFASPMFMRQRKKADITAARINERQMQLALLESSEGMKSLRTELPAELIEGTPRPMNVPNLEMPANGPAGSATWSMAEHSKKPASPSSSVSKAVAGNAAAASPSLDFGDGVAFGAGRGDGSGGSGSGGGFAYDSRRAAKQGGENPVSERASLARNSELDAAEDSFSDVRGPRARATARAAGEAGITVVRESAYPTEHESPDLPNAPTRSWAGGKPFPVTPATPAEMALDESDASVRSNSALIYDHDQRVDQVRHDLYEAQEKNETMLPDDAVALAKAVRDQEDKVEERRKVLSTIVRTKGIIYKGQDSFYQTGGVDEDQGARNALEVLHKIEQEKLQLESQINSLLKYDSDQLMVYASGLDLPDNNIRKLYPQYLEAKRQLDAEKAKGLGEKHPTVRMSVDQIDQMKRQLDEGVINLRSTLQAQLDLATNRLKSVETMKDQTREESIKRALDAQDYVDAKKEFEKDQELLQQMKLKLMASSMKAKPEPPKPDLAKLMEEIPASEEPYSTFSLNISDASFQVAQAALAKGEQPDPAGIKVEQFYNAVDYGDPAPSAGEPVAVAIEQAAHPVIPGRNLVRIALKTAAAGRSASQPLRLTLLVDQSGSMVREDRRAAMDKALAGLSELLTANDLVTVIGFSRTPRLLADGMTGDKAGKLAGLVNQAASEGGTNLEEAIRLGAHLADRRKLAGAQNRIVLFTDGAANLGNADPQRLAEKVRQLRQNGIAFDIAGIAADGLNDELLGELARNGNGRYHVVGKGADNDFAKQLAGAFRPAAENVKVQVRFNPERVGRYKLIGFEKDRLKTEDFRNDRVDAAELAAEEAGVAIYQVEPKPEGNGELGEVSVRFRDAASGGMVERTWTIPHEPGAPAIDRATPSMQLAALAMLAGEKLRGGPLAEAIDFKQLTGPQANVKRFFGSNARVAEVLRMVEMLK
jgi:hypothetical protein